MNTERIRLNAVPAAHQYLLMADPEFQEAAEAAALRQGRRERMAHLRGEGLMLMEMRHRREMRRQTAVNAALGVWSLALVAAWVVVGLTDVRLSHVAADQRAVIAAQRIEIGGLTGQKAAAQWAEETRERLAAETRLLLAAKQRTAQRGRL